MINHVFPLMGIITMAVSFTNLPAGLPPLEEIPALKSEVVFPSYHQHLRLTFANANAPGRAKVSIAPLLNNHQRAVSSRWDDNIVANEEVKRRLDAQGVKATWYLNSNHVAYLKGEDYRPIAKRLLENGHSIGSHAASHPYLTYLNRNRMFQELASVRIEWEAELDTPVLSHSFSFIDFRNEHEGDLSQADALRSLERAGLYHLAEFKTTYDALPSDLIYSVIMPPENQSYDTFVQAVDWAVGNAECREKFPLISHSMHGWYASPALNYGWDELERRLAYLGRFEDFWQTNQNAYAAYRYQYKHTTLTCTLVDSNLLLDIERPRVRYLNDNVPLTLSISGVDISELTTAELDGIALPITPHPASVSLINVPHSSNESIPKCIGRVENLDNLKHFTSHASDPKFPGIQALLSFDENPQLIIRNESSGALRDVTVTWRLPLQWNPGWITESLSDIEPNGELKRILDNVERTENPVLRDGAAYLVAQLDFIQNGEPKRIHLSCQLAPEWDRTFPRDGFSMLGPFDPRIITVQEISEAISKLGQPLSSLSTPAGMDATLVAGRPKATFDVQWLDPEIVPTQADWYQLHSPVYVLQSIVTAKTDTEFLLQCHAEDIGAVWLNGQHLGSLRGHMRKGENNLAIIYFHQGTQTPARHSAAFFRFVDPATGNRLHDLHFTPMSLAASAKE